MSKHADVDWTRGEKFQLLTSRRIARWRSHQQGRQPLARPAAWHGCGDLACLAWPPTQQATDEAPAQDSACSQLVSVSTNLRHADCVAAWRDVTWRSTWSTWCTKNNSSRRMLHSRCCYRYQPNKTNQRRYSPAICCICVKLYLTDGRMDRRRE